MKSGFEHNFFSVNVTLNAAGRLIDLRTPRVMGILNVTPDSFYDGHPVTTVNDLLKRAEKMLAEGATFLDVGGYSTRPGAADISVAEETARVLPLVQQLVTEFPEAVISVDTFRGAVARAAVESGAHLINDVSGGTLDDAMFDTVAALGVPYILMHMRGTPQTMTQRNEYTNLLKDIVDFFHLRIAKLQQLGVKDIIIDPGFGFAKNVEQNFALLNSLQHFQMLGKPLLAGLSRKSMIWRTLSSSAEDALNGTSTLNTVALLKGARILRVHDVKPAMEVVKLVQAMHTSAA
jgi:dihydropteroate synthase